jgi:hypothetical protein
MPDMSGAVERTVKASGGNYTPAQFQTALNDAGTANEKRIITVDAGLTITGQVSMPANADQNWIIIRSSAHASLTEGKRVLPANAGSMFKIRNLDVDPAITFAAGSNHIRIIGAEITIDPSALADAPGGANQGGLVNFTQNVSRTVGASSLPKFIGLDRCYIHGLPSKSTGRGVFAMGEDLFFIDSYYYDFHFAGFDGQAILGLDVKRWKILNNTLVGTSENFMWGGDGMRLDGYQIGELEYLRNHMYNPCEWKPDGGCGATYGGFDWFEKNLFECKTCAKVFAFGNFFGGRTDAEGGFWPDAQQTTINLKLEQNSGRVVSFTITNGGSGYTSAPTVTMTHTPGCVHGQCAAGTATINGSGQVTGITVTNNGIGYCLAPTVTISGGGGSGATATANIAAVTLDKQEDILFYKNLIKNQNTAVAVVGHTIPNAAACGGIPARVAFLHNIIEGDAETWDAEPGASSGSWNATAWTLGGTHHLNASHNTAIATPSQSGACNSVFGDGMMLFIGDTPPTKHDNFIFRDNIVDFRGCGVVGGFINGNNATGSLNNVFNSWTVTNNGIVRTGGAQALFPTGQLWESSWTGRFVSFNNGRDGNYRLAGGTAWDNAASDGTDLGADIDGVELATANTPTGEWGTGGGTTIKCNWHTSQRCN